MTPVPTSVATEFNSGERVYYTKKPRHVPMHNSKVSFLVPRFFLACTLPDAANIANEITARTKSCPRQYDVASLMYTMTLDYLIYRVYEAIYEAFLNHEILSAIDFAHVPVHYSYNATMHP